VPIYFSILGICCPLNQECISVCALITESSQWRVA